MKIIFHFGPVRGITDVSFYQLFHQFFPHFNSYTTPFLTPDDAKKKGPKQHATTPSSALHTIPIVPQVLAKNATELTNLCAFYVDEGYTHVSWNLGCPYPMVVKRGRGAALLAQADALIDILEQALPKLRNELSIKTRLGVKNPAEFAAILPRLNAFPLREITIHGRTAAQMYQGVTHFEPVREAVLQSTHRIVLNGDIRTAEDIRRLQAQFANHSDFMIARGALFNPFIVEDIRQTSATARLSKQQRLHAFHSELSDRYRRRLQGDAHFLKKMSEHWQYFAYWFPNPKKTLKAVRKATSIAQYLKVIDSLRLPESATEPLFVDYSK